MLLAALDGLDDKRLVLRFGDDGVHLVLGVQLKLLVALAVVACGEVGVGLVAVEHRIEQPILLTHEAFYLFFTVDDHSRCDRLDTACRKAALYFLPKQRRELVADKAVKQSSRLLGIYKILVDVTGIAHALGYYLFRYLIKGHSSCLVVRQGKQLL